MNATEMAKKSINPRLHRIQTVSRLAKYVCFVFLAFVAGFSILMFIQCHLYLAFDSRSLLTNLFQIVLCVWYWKLSRLFHFYEQGLIFAAGTIRCIKTLGLLYVIGGMITSLLHFFPKVLTSTPSPLPPGVTVSQTVTHSFRMGFFNFDFGTGIDFGVLLAGAVIVLIAWIMDEGRKIQEEQELTV